MVITPKAASIPQHTNLKKTKFQLIAVAKIDRYTIRNNTYELEQVRYHTCITIFNI